MKAGDKVFYKWDRLTIQEGIVVRITNGWAFVEFEGESNIIKPIDQFLISLPSEKAMKAMGGLYVVHRLNGPKSALP